MRTIFKINEIQIPKELRGSKKDTITISGKREEPEKTLEEQFEDLRKEISRITRR